jgi:L-cysteine S-thiosulfotransferase
MRAVTLALCALLSSACMAAPDARRSGFDDMTPPLQAMQRDDALNPAMLSVREGEALWRTPPAPGQQACAACHGDASKSMRGVAPRYPAFSTAAGIAPQRPVTLHDRINECRVAQQHTAPLAVESPAALSLLSFVALQSRGLPIAPPADPRLQPYRDAGAALYTTRFGQLALSCAQCHDARAGLRLGGSTIPQAHPNGYPLYRLEWQGMGSLQRRLRGCMAGVRAEPFATGAPEWVALELYLMQRAAGMALEAPAVRP